MLAVLIRSIGRSTLERALSSVALQNQSDLMVVLVDARGDLIQAIEDACDPVSALDLRKLQALVAFNSSEIKLGFPKQTQSQPAFGFPSGWPDFSAYPFRVLLVSTGEALRRARAADLALKIGALLSEYAIFLDDDDVFLEGHIESLRSALAIHQGAVAAHTAAILDSGTHSATKATRHRTGKHAVGRFFEPWELLYSNHIPIHCALFRTAPVLERTLSFDEQFDLYEDWDFWLQLRCIGDFQWVEGLSALYVVDESSESPSLAHRIKRDEEPYRKLWQKWRLKAPAQWWFDLLAATGPKLNQLEAFEQTVDHLSEVKLSLEGAVALLNHQLHAKEEASQALRHDLENQLAENRSLHERLAHAYRETLGLRNEFQALELDLKATIHTQLSTIGAQQSTIEAQQAATIEQLQREAGLRDELARTLAAAQQWQHRSESLSSQVGQLQAQLQAMLHSRSWRITGPLRRLGTLARRAGFGRMIRRLRQIQIRLVERPKAATASSDLVAVDSSEKPQQAWDIFHRVPDPYQDWIERYESKCFDLEVSRRALKAPESGSDRVKPLVSIIMPVFNAPFDFFVEAINSVRQQHSPNWELCVADDASTDKASLDWLKTLMKQESRIKLLERNENGHISACSNAALTLASTDWVALMDQDDRLSPFAVTEVLSAIERFPQAKVIYSDEDKIDERGVRSNPYFKPAFNLELLRAQNMVSHFGVYSRALVDAVGGFRIGMEGSQDHDLVLRCVERVAEDQIIHIPKVLYHWRIHQQSTASTIDAKPYAISNGLKAVNDHLERSVPGAKALLHEAIAHYHVQYPLPLELPSIEVIIPTKNGYELVGRCLETFFKLTRYPSLHLTIVDHESDDERLASLLGKYKNDGLIDVIRYEGAFNFSAINNHAVANTQSDYVLFLNNDIEVISSDWLDTMLRQAVRPEVGAVGAMLYYPDKTMQHAGVVIGAGGVAGHAHHRLPAGHPGYFGRAALALEVSSVTAACLLMRRRVFEEVGGFDAQHLAVAFNDVDLCLKVRRLGYKVIFAPRAQLIHHESATRGDDLSPEHRDRFERECAVMKQRWPDVINNDPAYNPNLEIMATTYQAYCPSRDARARTGNLPSMNL